MGGFGLISALSIEDLQLFLAVIEAGSFRKAATALRIDVATLSRRVARLENELGVLLFERGRAGVKSTVAGASTIDLARRAIADIDAIRHNAMANSRAEQGRLRLGTHLSTIGPMLRGLLDEWRRAHPAVALDLLEIDDCALLVGLRERELSAAICFCPMLPDEIATEQLWVESLFVALPASHELADCERIGWPELRFVPLLVRSWSGSNAYREMQAQLVGPGANLRPIAADTFNLLNLVPVGEGAMIAMA